MEYPTIIAGTIGYSAKHCANKCCIGIPYTTETDEKNGHPKVKSRSNPCCTLGFCKCKYGILYASHLARLSTAVWYETWCGYSVVQKVIVSSPWRSCDESAADGPVLKIEPFVCLYLSPIVLGDRDNALILSCKISRKILKGKKFSCFFGIYA